MAKQNSKASGDCCNKVAVEYKTRKKRLHDYFAFDKFPSNEAVIYINGNLEPKRLSYLKLHLLACQIEEKVEECVDSWCVGCSVEMNHLFPAIQIGIMRTGKTVCNISVDDYYESTVALKKKLNLKYAILDRTTFEKKEKWIKAYLTVKEEFSVTVDKKQYQLYIVLLPAKDDVEDQSAGLLSAVPERFEYAYIMQTTGTTGKRKIVLVPHECIVPNIEDFISVLWGCQPTDVVFGSSPTTFDPAMVELFAALGSGASILYVPNYVKLDGQQLGIIFSRHNVSIFPCTPSLFRKIAVHLSQAGIFDPEMTSLKVLCFGGEKCPTKTELKSLIGEEMGGSLRSLINVYGVTEVSCWASYSKIDLSNDHPISIGTPLSETYVGVDFKSRSDLWGEIVIESSTRVCKTLDDSGFVKLAENILPRNIPDDKSSKQTNFSYKTGDIGLLEVGGVGFDDRADDIVKRCGMKVPLHMVSERAMDSGVLEAAQCVSFEDKTYLLIVPKRDFSKEIGLQVNVQAVFIPEFRLEGLPPPFYPDCIFAMHSIPLNENGKINIPEVLRTIRQSVHSPRTNISFKIPMDFAEDVLQNMWTCYLPGNPPAHIVRKNNFIDLGGTSLGAVKVIDNVHTLLKLRGYSIDSENRLLGAMFAGKFSLVAAELKEVLSERDIPAQIVQITAPVISEPKVDIFPDPYEENSSNTEFNERDQYSASSSRIDERERDRMFVNNRNITYTSHQSPGEFSTNRLYKLDLVMCVDAKIAVALSGFHEGMAVVGSQSGHVACFCLKEAEKRIKVDPRAQGTDFCYWYITLPDGVEAEATFTKNSLEVFVACHNFRLYRLSVTNGQITGYYEGNGAIRTKPLLTDLGNAIVSLDETSTVTCLDVNKLTIIWSRVIEDKTVSTYDIVVASDVVCLTTIIGNLIALSTADTLSKVWLSAEPMNKYTTAPVGFQWSCEKNAVVVGSMYGIKCLDLCTGKLIWSYQEKLVVDHALHPLVHQCDLISACQISMITKEGRVVSFNCNGEKLYEFFMRPTTSSPLVMCSKLTPQAKFYKNEDYPTDGNSDGQTHVFLSYPSKGQSLMVYHISSTYVLEEAAFRTHKLQRESFSSIIRYNNLIIFGARDNKVHILYVE